MLQEPNRTSPWAYVDHRNVEKLQSQGQTKLILEHSLLCTHLAPYTMGLDLSFWKDTLGMCSFPQIDILRVPHLLWAVAGSRISSHHNHLSIIGKWPSDHISLILRGGVLSTFGLCPWDPFTECNERLLDKLFIEPLPVSQRSVVVSFKPKFGSEAFLTKIVTFLILFLWQVRERSKWISQLRIPRRVFLAVVSVGWCSLKWSLDIYSQP